MVDTALAYAPWLAPLVLAGSLAFIYDGLLLGLTEGRVLRNALLVASLGVFLPLAAVARGRESSHLLWLALAAFMAARWGLLAWAGREKLGSPAAAG